MGLKQIAHSSSSSSPTAVSLLSRVPQLLLRRLFLVLDSLGVGDVRKSTAAWYRSRPRSRGAVDRARTLRFARVFAAGVETGVETKEAPTLYAVGAASSLTAAARLLRERVAGVETAARAVPTATGVSGAPSTAERLVLERVAGVEAVAETLVVLSLIGVSGAPSAAKRAERRTGLMGVCIAVAVVDV